nr:O-antigen translocase [uncultured Flavobacterium sp.]
MSEAKSSYRQILKAASLFGGVQFFAILISIVRSKVIAVLLGPSGIGISTLLTSTMALLNGVTGFGLETSAVKIISEKNSLRDNVELGREVSILSRLTWFTGLFGMLLTMVLSPWLSTIIFDSEKYTIAIVLIAVALLFKQLSGSQLAVLQGLRKLNHLAKANLLGNLFGLIISIPLYYYWKADAIAPAIVISTFIGLVFSWFYRRKIQVRLLPISSKQAILEGKNLMRLGFVLSLSGLITIVAGYVLQLFINHRSGVAEVGFYNAGFAILNSYVGMIFTAMGTDYFPKLSAFCNDNKKIKEMVNQQAFIGVLLITPIIVVFLTFTPIIVSLLYSSKFYTIVPMLTWGILGMLFRAVSWSMGFIVLAKGDSKLFIKTAIGFNLLSLLINGIGYILWGLEGLGIGFLVYFCIHFIGLKIITKRRYEFVFDREFYRLFICCIGICLVAFLATFISNEIIKFGLMGLMIILSVLFTFTELNKKVNLKEILVKLRRK